MKVAILVQGMWRTGSRCWPKIYAGFADYHPDIYYLSHEPDKEAQIMAAMRPTHIWYPVDEPQPEYDYGTSLGTGVKSLQVDLRQLADLRALSLDVKGIGIKYDWLVRTRTDLDMIVLPEPLETLDPNAVYIPCHDNWFGLNDRFMMGNPELVHRAMERYDRLPAFWLEHHVFHMETFLAWTMHGANVQRTRTTFGSWRTEKDRREPYHNPLWRDWPSTDLFRHIA
jgi:hypothetical protein